MNKEKQKRQILGFLQGKAGKDIDAFSIYQWIERCHFEGWWNLALSLIQSVPPNSLDQDYHKRLNYLLSDCRNNLKTARGTVAANDQSVERLDPDGVGKMPLPDYSQLPDALLCFIFLNGGRNYQVRANETYNPLADFFGLSYEERNRPHPDGITGSIWQNRIRWTRQRLINEGYAEGRGRGIWGLTDEGLKRAKYIVQGYEKLKQQV